MVEIDPILAVRIAFQLQGTYFPQVGFRYLDSISDQCDSGRAKRGSTDVRFSHKQAGPWIRLQILRMHGHCADEEDGATLPI